MSLSKSRKRSYRYRVKCEECEKEFDSDYVEAHSRIVHSGRKVRCLPVVESSQLKLSGFCSKSSAAVESPGQKQEASLVGCSPESEQRTISSTDESVANIQRDLKSIEQGSLMPDASIRDVQRPSEPSTPIDKGIQSDLGGIAEPLLFFWGGHYLFANIKYNTNYNNNKTFGSSPGSNLLI